MELDAFRQYNFDNWEDRAPIHAASESYNLQAYIDDPLLLSGVVSRDAPHLGRLDGKDVVHLQCHIGTDTISLTRLGARTTTGYDFSPSSLEVGRGLAAATGNPVTFVHGELYQAADVLGREEFDLVYTGAGALNWLPDVRGWAQVVAALLRPGGRLYIREGHPMLYTIDENRDDDLLVVKHPYFETVEPYLDDSIGTYTDGDTSAMTHGRTAEWNHGIGEVVQAVIDAGLILTQLVEHRAMEWNALPIHMERQTPNDARHTKDTCQLRRGADRLPLMYTLQARKPA